MSKHLDKIEKALRDRIASAPNGPGFKKPGSMNKKKTGYLGHKAKRKGAWDETGEIKGCEQAVPDMSKYRCAAEMDKR